MTTMRVLVTGGAGFVGSALVRQLVEDGCRVTVFDNMCRGHRENLTGLPVHLVVGDICTRRAIAACMDAARPEVVFHLAAMHFLPDCNRRPTACIHANVYGTEQILRSAAATGVARVVCPTSMAVYPITDAQVAETHPVGPYDIYGETKVMNEMQLGRWSRATGGTAVPVRLANVYGPRETNMHVVPEIMTQLGQGRRCLTLGDTRPYRDYIHTSDVARAMASLGVCDRLGRYEVFNLGTGTEHSVDDILSVLGDLLGEVISVCRDERHVRKIERMHLWPDTGKLRRVTGWAPRVELREGLRELCEIYGVPVRV